MIRLALASLFLATCLAPAALARSPAISLTRPIPALTGKKAGSTACWARRTTPNPRSKNPYTTHMPARGHCLP